MIGFAIKVAAVVLGFLLGASWMLVEESFQREDVWLDLLATKRALIRERAALNLRYAEDMTEQVVHSACLDTCQALDYDTDNRDGPKFVYTCASNGPHGFICIWENLDENLRPKRVRGKGVR